MAHKLCYGTKGRCIKVICNCREVIHSRSLLKASTTESSSGRGINVDQFRMGYGTLRRIEMNNLQSFECEWSTCSMRIRTRSRSSAGTTPDRQDVHMARRVL